MSTHGPQAIHCRELPVQHIAYFNVVLASVVRATFFFLFVIPMEPEVNFVEAFRKLKWKWNKFKSFPTSGHFGGFLNVK